MKNNEKIKSLLELNAAVKELELEIAKIASSLYDGSEKKCENTELGTKEEKEENSAAEADYKTMASKDLYALCCKRGISSKCTSRKKVDLIKILEEYDMEQNEEGSASGADSDDEWEENAYDSMTDIELYKECKKRGLQVKKRMNREMYITKLKEDDADNASGEGDSEDDDDDWTI